MRATDRKQLGDLRSLVHDTNSEAWEICLHRAWRIPRLRVPALLLTVRHMLAREMMEEFIWAYACIHLMHVGEYPDDDLVTLAKAPPKGFSLIHCGLETGGVVNIKLQRTDDEHWT